jgi:copper chaperone NosL
MKQLPRVMMIGAALCLLMVFVYPLWKIQLFAPQYPDGVEMHIWINKIGGATPGTLQNVNILNHYVGMKPIVPDSIPELQYFKYFIFAMIGLGVISGIVNRKSVFLIWTLLLTALCILGMYDFYMWEYDYGHNLDEKAPIIIPGASFQPPLIGRKDILNFIAVSLPHIAGYFVMLSVLLGFSSWYLKRKNDRHEKKVTDPPGTSAPVPSVHN